jgi:hypothetical protein
MHVYDFQRRSKLHESEGRVQFEIFEKLTRNQTITYLKKVMQKQIQSLASA